MESTFLVMSNFRGGKKLAEDVQQSNRQSDSEHRAFA